MIGRNTFTLNSATVQRAVEEYLDRQRRESAPKLRVQSVQGRSSSGPVQEFVVEVMAEEPKPDAGGSST